MSSYQVVSYEGHALPKTYHALVFARWLKTLRSNNEYFRLIDSDSYYKSYHRYIEKILDELDSVVRLAVLSDDQDIVLGFSVVRFPVLDYVHVHKDQRRQGIAKCLVPPGIDTISHLTKIGMTIWGSKYGHWKFNPFA